MKSSKGSRNDLGRPSESPIENKKTFIDIECKKKKMKVRYSYLRQQFSNCDDLWKKLKKFVYTGDFTLGKELTIFEKK